MIGLRAMLALTRRELVRLVRQPSRIVTSIGVPIILWLLAGSGLSGSFALPSNGEMDISYAQFILPGIVTAVVLFSTIFASMSLIQDRQSGFLQSVLVSPAPRWSVAGSKVLGGTIVTTAQATIVLFAAWGVGLHPGFSGIVLSATAVALTSAAVISMGLALAWWINSTAGFHGIMNAVLMPMWLLSGALFPPSGASTWLGALVRINPLHWCTRAIAGPLGIDHAGVTAWTVTIAFAGGSFLVALLAMSRTGSGSAAASQGE